MNYYDKINWKNRSEGKTTKISAERLNHMDNQIFNNANAIGNVEKIADIGDGTLCGAAETLKETAEKLTQSLSKITVVKEYENLDTTLNGMSQASNFNEYTIKEDGLYYISANLFGAKSATSRTLIGVQKNGRAITTEHNGSGYYGIEASHIYQCTVGDTISGRFYNENAQVNKTNNLLCQIVRLK